MTGIRRGEVRNHQSSRRRFRMVPGEAVRMIRKHLDHSAVGDFSALALNNHAFEFGFERAQSGNAAFDLSQLSAGDPVGGVTGLPGIIGEAQEFADRVERETEFPAVADEGETLQVLRPVAPLVASGAQRLWHQANLLVIADGLHLTACAPGKQSDRQVYFHDDFSY
jgi:hypothetical protein